LQAAASAMGTASVKTIQYSGTGWNAAVGQSFGPAEDWPQFEVTRYTRAIDYDAKFSREELTRRQGNNPPRGGGGTPLQGEQQQAAIVSGNYAWNMDGQNAVPQAGQYLAGIPVAEFRQLDILLTPHGFLKAALAANATAISLTFPGSPGAITQNGKATVVSFTAMGKYRVNGTFNDQNLLELVQTWIPNPVYGDMLYELRYTNYKDFGGVKHPRADEPVRADRRTIEESTDGNYLTLTFPAAPAVGVLNRTRCRIYPRYRTPAPLPVRAGLCPCPLFRARGLGRGQGPPH
jgi:hypothetical protein